MVTELQYIAIAAYLIWCLVCSLCDIFTSEDDVAHGPEPQAGSLVSRN